jgi:hypothetical protein
LLEPLNAVFGDMRRVEQPAVASKHSAQPVALEAGIRFFKAAGSVEEADKTSAIIREVARAVVTPF